MDTKKIDALYNTLIEDINTCIMEYNEKLTEEKLNIKLKKKQKKS